jgi:hypothetical protein
MDRTFLVVIKSYKIDIIEMAAALLNPYLQEDYGKDTI